MPGERLRNGEAGVDREAILEALKVASIVSGVAQAIATTEVLANA